jgi:hypothetical protein
MKVIKSMIIGLMGLVSFTSCEEWLDVNVNPNTPTDLSATIVNRLPHIEFYTNDAYQFASMRTFMAMGDMTMNSRTSTYGYASQWQPLVAQSTTPYQWFFVGAGSNLQTLYDKAMEQGAWHYAAASRLIHAYGYMLMTDLYGEMPYTEGLGESATPKYDTGKTIYLGCLSEIDEVIELLSKTQETSVPALSLGDTWANGDVNKWLKMAYLLKARWINKLNKKQAGSYKDGKYDADEILVCLAKAQSSNADNVIYDHTDDYGPSRDVLGWNEPVDYSPMYSVLGMNSNYYVTQMMIDNFTNFAGSGVEDPRADHVIPWAYSSKGASSPEGLKWVGNWRRTAGIDMHTLTRLDKHPYTTSYDVSKGGWYIDPNAGTDCLGDTIYVQTTCGSKGYGGFSSLLYEKLKSDPKSRQSGVFYGRPSSPTWIATYHEACFIKAEVLFKKGDKLGAFTAYKEGIKANIELMNQKLKVWVGEDAALAECPSFTPIEQSAIDNYLAQGIGTESNLTLAKIMTQKRMAMLWSIEVFNDMRRYNYDSDVFLNWEIPAEYYVNNNAQRCIPLGKQYRRWQQCSHETNYNAANLQAIGAEVPGANMSAKAWNMDEAVWSVNVWWDSEQE